jgi:hypothetical protein
MQEFSFRATSILGEVCLKRKFARETMKHFDNQDGPVKRPTRKSFSALKDTHRFRFRLYEKEELEGLRRAGEALSGGDFRAWLSSFKLPDTLEIRIRYRAYLDVKGEITDLS